MNDRQMTGQDQAPPKFFYINKPAGITSHDVVNKIRIITGEGKVGHAGTLDSFATGLLIVGVGRQATKELNKFLKKEKTYTGTIQLGSTSSTDDPEGEIVERKCSPPIQGEIKRVFSKYVGQLSQLPPKYSAVKIKGKKAYEIARKGETPELKPRKVTIFDLKLKSYSFPHIEFEAKVSSGTYIRSLARDIGEDLGCGAYLTTLDRTKIGNIDAAQAKDLERIEKEFRN